MRDDDRAEMDSEAFATPTRPEVVGAGGPRLLTRRRVLFACAGTATIGALGAVGLGSFRAYQRFGREPSASVRDHRVELEPGKPKLAIARGADPARNVEAVLAAFGGMKSFVSRGDVVLVKPNIAWERSPAHAANTDPRVVAAVVKACRQAGADEVIVTDCPCHDPSKTFRISGIQRAAEAAGAKVVLPHELGHRPVRVSDRLGTWEVLEAFLQPDKIINVPVAKHHGSARVTAGMKNWIGITLRSRGEFHTALDQTIAELAALMRPTLTLVDATRVLIRNGPKGGNLADVKEEKTLAAGVDPVALDAWAAELLGAKRNDVRYLAIAERMGLGTVDYRSLKPKVIDT